MGATPAEGASASVTPVADTNGTADERPTDRGLSLLLYAIRTRELSLIDMNLVTDSAFELLDITKSELKEVRFDPTVLTDMRDAVV